MSVSNEEIDDLIDRTVREIRVVREKRERSTVTTKTRKLDIHKDRIYRRLKDIESRINRKTVNLKFSIV